MPEQNNACVQKWLEFQYAVAVKIRVCNSQKFTKWEQKIALSACQNAHAKSSPAAD